MGQYTPVCVYNIVTIAQFVQVGIGNIFYDYYTFTKQYFSYLPVNGSTITDIATESYCLLYGNT